MQLTNANKGKRLVLLPSVVDASAFVAPLDTLDMIVAADTTVHTDSADWISRLADLPACLLDTIRNKWGVILT